VAADSLAIYDRYHAHQSQMKGWPNHPTDDSVSYFDSFVDQPFPVEEWRYTIDGRLVGVGIVDRLPGSLSAVYFFSEPDERPRGLGTWNVLSVIDRARALQLPFVYLGYHIPECPSLAYKANFTPNQKQSPAGEWQVYRT
jgi:arginine-tRNA-protein transferase